MHRPKRSSHILVLTALPLESDAFCMHLQDVSNVDLDGEQYRIGRLGVVTIVVAETGMGNVDAAIAASRAMSRYKPQLVVFVGVAGGVKDVNLGDIVYSSRVSNPLFGKEKKKGEFSSRPQDHVPPKYLLDLAEALAKSNWKSSISKTAHGTSEVMLKAPPKAIPGRISSTDSVIAGEVGPLSEIIQDHYGDTKAVDMEGFGVLRAAYKCGDYDSIVIRGISDLRADKEGDHDEIWQPIAAANASAFASCLIRDFLSSPTQTTGMSKPIEADVAQMSDVKTNKEPASVSSNTVQSVGQSKEVGTSQIGEANKGTTQTAGTAAPVSNGDHGKAVIPPPSGGDKMVAREKSTDPKSPANQLWRFYDMPGIESGKIVEITVKFTSKGFPLLQYECDALSLEMGYSISRRIELVVPGEIAGQLPFLGEVYAGHDFAEWMYDAPKGKELKILARLTFGAAKRELRASRSKRVQYLMQGEEPPTEFKTEYVHGMVLVKVLVDN